MSRLATYVVRFVLILTGFLAACAAASLFVNVLFVSTVGAVIPEFAEVAGPSLFVTVPFLTLIIANLAFGPFLLVAVAAELLGWRSWIAHASGGAVVARMTQAPAGFLDTRSDLAARATVDAAQAALRAAGTDLALETADMVLMSDDIGRLPFAFGLARATRKIVVSNIVISLGIVFALVPVAMLGGLHMTAAVILHEGSTLLVIFNALRLLGFERNQAA